MSKGKAKGSSPLRKRKAWIRKSELDASLHRYLPIPTQVVSNEEFVPIPQTPEQKAVEHHLVEMASRISRSMGMDRRAFLRTSCGMPESLMKQFGYAPLTTEVKRKIFGLNAARVYGIDLAATRHPVPDDYVARLKEMYKGSNLGGPSNTQYGWVLG